MNDHYIDRISETKESVRINKSNSSLIKNDKLKFIIKKFNPDYIIFNFVSYGYNCKGVPFWLLTIAKTLSDSKISVLVYFHELWIGQFKHEPLKSKFLGFFQRFVLLKFISILKPREVFTSTEIFKDILKSKKIEAGVIPVFNNVSGGLNVVNSKRSVIDQYKESTIFLCFFGSILRDYECDKLFRFLLEQQKILGLEIVVLSIGNQKGGTSIWNKLTNLENEKIHFHNLGVMPALEVSSILRFIDYGLTSYPIEFWSKSGSIAAMLAHELKIIAFESSTVGVFEKYKSKIPSSFIILKDSFESIKLKKKEIYNVDYKKYNYEIFNLMHCKMR